LEPDLAAQPRTCYEGRARPGPAPLMARGRRKTIAVIIDSLDAAGAQKQAFLLAKHMGSVHDVTLVVLAGERIDGVFPSRMDELPQEPLLLRGWLLKRMLSLFRFLKRRKTDIIFTYLLKPNLVGGLVAILAGVKLRVGGIRNSVLHPSKEPLERLIHNHLSTITVFNCFSGPEMLGERGFNRDKAVVIPNCFELGEPPRSRASRDEPCVLSVGRFAQQKDYHTALRAISRLRASGKELKYIIIGWGELADRIRAWVSELGLDDTVEIVVNPDLVDPYYRRADIFLMTSLFEGLSNALMEAMSHSLPVVATAVGDNDRLVLHGETGYLVEPGDATEVAAALDRLIDSHELRLRLGLAGYRKLAVEYDVDRFLERYCRLVDHIAGDSEDDLQTRG